MLAALLLNLADYQERQGGGGAYLREERKKRSEKWATTPDRTWSLTEVWNRLNEAVEELPKQVKSKPVKAIKKLKPRIEKVTGEEWNATELSDLIRDLSIAEFELKQSLLGSNQERPEMVLVLQSLTLLISYLEQDEEDILCLLLSL